MTYRMRSITPVRLGATLLLTALFFASSAAASRWEVVSDSSNVAFVSVKNGVVAEAHNFAGVSGAVDSRGAATVHIDLASVDTLIPIRDERMRNLLFQVSRFPEATLRAEIDLEALAALEVGDSVAADLNGELDLHGAQSPIVLNARVTRVGNNRVLVTSLRPVVLMADTFELGAGLEALREIAGLASITPAVPVSFTLLLERSADP